MYTAQRAFLPRGTVKRTPSFGGRVMFVIGLFGCAGLILVGRFFQLQVLDHQTYQMLASDQHEIQSSLVPRRGAIYLQDPVDSKLYPLAIDRDSWLVYAAPKEVKDPTLVAETLAPILNLAKEDLLPKVSATSSYIVLAKDVALDKIQEISSKRLTGVGISKDVVRLYPEEGMGGQMIGFVSQEDRTKRIGRYGIEGSFQDVLAGEFGTLLAEKDAAGRRLITGNLKMTSAKDGSDLVLTIDRMIQYTACAKIREAVQRFDARGGTIVILNPQTGAVLAMCSTPDFEPASYGKIEDVGVLNNPATFAQFEPGSIFKPITLAAGLDAGKITPKSTYEDRGEETMDGFTVRNSDKLAHGLQTMTQVLEKSLNTGTIYVARLIGRDAFREYVQRFGFGKKTGIGFQPEAKGDVSSLDRSGKIFMATASYGQGISATPLQMVAAFGALGNGGTLMKPYIVKTILHSDGTKEEIQPEPLGRAVSERTARLMSGMLVSVVENGHGKRAGVPGYYVAGKTGTAQIPNPNGKGYLDGTQSIGSFIGFAPADNPKFAMIVTFDRPKLEWAESSAAPIFGEMAKFLLSYLHVPPDRPIKEKAVPVATSTQP